MCIINGRGQTAAIIESKISNAGDAIWNRHRGQTAATMESPISNACDAIGNCICALFASGVLNKGCFVFIE